MAMATKAKLLLRELKGVKTDLAFTKARCTQLEEENKRLRESIDKGSRHEEDDLVKISAPLLSVCAFSKLRASWNHTE